MIILKGVSGAVSLPSAAFRAADLLATRLGITRRELDATALADFVERWSRLEREQRGVGSGRMDGG
jgi:hypothetical protein